MANDVILLVEYNPDDRRSLRERLQAADCEVREASQPSDVTPQMATGIKLLLTHIYFHNSRGKRDYRAAAALCRQVREWAGSMVPIVGLASTFIDEDFKEQILNHRA